MNELTFSADCPCCGRPATWTAQQVGNTYPDIRSRITRIEHQETP